MIFILKALICYESHILPRRENYGQLENNTKSVWLEKRECNVLEASLLCAIDSNESCTSGTWSRTASGDRGALDHIPMATPYKWF